MAVVKEPRSALVAECWPTMGDRGGCLVPAMEMCELTFDCDTPWSTRISVPFVVTSSQKGHKSGSGVKHGNCPTCSSCTILETQMEELSHKREATRISWNTDSGSIMVHFVHLASNLGETKHPGSHAN